MKSTTFSGCSTISKILHLWIIFSSIQDSLCADLVIEIPGNNGQDDSSYRLDYYPPYGYPPPNTTISSREIGDEIQFSGGLPGTKYSFWLYYTNATHHDWLTWTVSITTAPDPPSNLSVIVKSGKYVTITWSPPFQGNFSSFKLRILSLSDQQNSYMNRTISITDESFQHQLKDLTPGVTYQIQAYTIFDGKESVAYTSRNFTTKRLRHKDIHKELLDIKILREPNTPGKFIVWFRNETTLLVLWQPPYPAGIYTHYKVSIDPSDAIDSVLYVEKEGEPPGPAQAAFKGLIPGRAYNISVQTMSEDEISLPTTAQYRTVPLRPLNVTFDRDSITEHSFKAIWEPPRGLSEFDKYQVSLSTTQRRQQGVAKTDDGPVSLEFKDNLEPGKTYQVVVKTVSGKVTSWPATTDITLKPLPVNNLAVVDDSNGIITIMWSPDVQSTQDEYRISYHEVDGSSNGDSSSMNTDMKRYTLENLLPGRNYTITVQAISKKMESNETTIYITTRPSAPIIEDLKSIREGLNISWKSDVNSKQEQYEVTYARNDTGETKTVLTKDTRLVFKHLYPGAGYIVKVFAISNELKSEPHEYFQAVYPYPPRNMTIQKVTSNSVLVHWLPPENSIFTEYSIRYRTESDKQWVRLPSVNSTEADVTDMTPGEKYTIQVNTVSYSVESPSPQQFNQTVRPNAVANVVTLVDSNNITLEWSRPEGRVETYIINWWPSDSPDHIHSKNISEQNIAPIIHNDKNGEVKEEHPLVQVLIDDLKSGFEYNFQIQVTSYNLVSEITNLKVRTMPIIQSDIFIINGLEDEKNSVTITYTSTPRDERVKFDHYRFSIDQGIPEKEKAADDENHKVTFSDLIPGHLYNIKMWTVSGGVSSHPIQRHDRLHPEPITVLNATKISDTEIVLTWDKPPGEYNAFEVQYLVDDHYIQNLTTELNISINNLKPHRNYTFTVVVRSGTEASVLKNSAPVSAHFTTLESLPGRVHKFTPTDIQPGEITFEWSLPQTEQNGIIQRYTVSYGMDHGLQSNTKNFSPPDQRGTIRNLVPGSIYTFKIQAKTSIGYGPETVWKQKMPIWAPPKPANQVVPTEVHRSSSTIQIRFRKNYFLDTNGAVIMYTIIVAEDDSKNSSGLEMPSWHDVQSYSIWPPYQAVEPYYPFKNSSINVEDFIIGVENCDKNRQKGYCNGPLKSGTTYRVKIRAFSAPDKFTDTAYSFPIQTDQDNTSLFVAITVPLILICILFVTLLFLRRRRFLCKRTSEARANDNMSLPDSTMETSRPVLIKNFAEHYRIMSADSDFRFSEEFEELKHVGRDQPCTFADLPCNRPKNRFTNILPYDHSRFKLQPVDDDEGSDYINANYVPGHNSPREFIVTQGPLHSTRDDFWRMCWESNSRAIVMLTRCYEKGREKCDHYWPMDTVPVYYGDIKVTLLNESHYPDWLITEFMMQRGETQRVMRHFHFSTWPDFGVPNPPQTLARFVRAFRERVGPDTRPIVVHCSAGVGRSGTFICLDRILQQIQVSDYVDIFGIVYSMRKERVWMVQTEQQYICIHQCLMAVLEGKENSGPPREIHDNQGYEDQDNTSLFVAITVPLILICILFVTLLFLRRRRFLCKRTSEARANDNMSLPDSTMETSRPVLIKNFAEHYRIMSADSDFRFSEEFEELKHVGRDQPCTFADLPCNRPKNRFTNILPYDHSRFKLQPVDDDEGSDYINANYVPGHNSPREFIVTQGPLHSTRDDFWRMCWESNSRAIVMLTRCYEKGREKCDHYWPMDTVPVYYGDIKVTLLNESHYPDWLITEFMMQRGETQRVMRHFHFSTWPDFGVPNPPQTLARFVRAFRERVGPDTRPIVVHCSAGVGRSGTFICLDRILQQIQVSDYVDIFGIVYSMRKERVWMVQTEQQYICIHQCLMAVLEGKENSGPPREIHDNQGYEAMIKPISSQFSDLDSELQLKHSDIEHLWELFESDGNLEEIKIQPSAIHYIHLQASSNTDQLVYQLYIIDEMEALISESAKYLDSIAVNLTIPLTVPDNLLGQTHDAQRSRNLFSELADAKNDSEQRSWMLYEDEVDITNYLTESIFILVDADPKICRYEMSCDAYNSVNNLVLYYQMEARSNIRKLLLKTFKAMCLLDVTCVDLLIGSVLPLELVQDMLTNTENLEKLSELSVMLIMIFSAAHKMPIGHFDTMNKDFVLFMLNLIENPLEDDQTEFLSDVMINLLLAFNLQFDDFTENTVLETMQQMKNFKSFTEKILLLINREEDPVFVLKHTKPPINSVLKILVDLFSIPETTNLFYTNDIKVLIDILVRQLSDLSAGDPLRKWYLELCRRILRNTDYAEHQHRALDLMKIFTRIFCEETSESIGDQQIVREISNEFPHIFKA